jgi:acyl-coenzyme A thioesterase PaaI-like protein
MPATTEDSLEYPQTCQNRHPKCWACAPRNGRGLKMQFSAVENGAVEGFFACEEDFSGYPGYLHGGIVSSLLDSAMTHCLMARGTPGLTGKLEVRFFKPVLIGHLATVRARWEKSRGPVHFLCAELLQNEEIQAKASGRFVDFPSPAPGKI